MAKWNCNSLALAVEDRETEWNGKPSTSNCQINAYGRNLKINLDPSQQRPAYIMHPFI